MGIETLIVIAVVAVIGLAFLGYEVDAWINGFLTNIQGGLIDADTAIPAPAVGSIACNVIVDIEWREKGTNVFTGVDAVLFLNSEGKTTNVEWDSCYEVGATGLPTASLLDFMASGDNIAPLDIIIGAQELWDKEYELSFILVDEFGLERKVQHYQSINYVVPALNLVYDFEQKLVFRNVELGDYTLKIVAENARFWEHSEGEHYNQAINAP